MADDLLKKDLLLLDGGLGTTLEDEHGVKFSSSETPLWSSHLLVENTTILKGVQRDFAEAGADIILTATYQASFQGFRNTRLLNKDGIDIEEAKKYMLSAVKIARDAFAERRRPGLVALSLGAYGATLVPGAEYSGEYGNMNEQDLFEFHLRRLSVFKDSEESWKDIDLVAIETIPRLDEVRAARKAVNTIARDKEYWISCVFPNEDQRLPDGTEIEPLVKTMLEGGERPPFAIGINCTKVYRVPGLVRKFEQAAQALSLDLPRLVIYPDGATSGMVYDTTLQQWVGGSGDNAGGPPWDEQVFNIVQDTISRGHWKGIIVGGCCKTAPTHVKRLRHRLDSWEKNH